MKNQKILKNIITIIYIIIYIIILTKITQQIITETEIIKLEKEYYEIKREEKMNYYEGSIEYLKNYIELINYEKILIQKSKSKRYDMNDIPITVPTNFYLKSFFNQFFFLFFIIFFKVITF
jgi:hypothetical protein